MPNAFSESLIPQSFPTVSREVQASSVSTYTPIHLPGINHMTCSFPKSPSSLDSMAAPSSCDGGVACRPIFHCCAAYCYHQQISRLPLPHQTQAQSLLTLLILALVHAQLSFSSIDHCLITLPISPPPPTSHHITFASPAGRFGNRLLQCKTLLSVQLANNSSSSNPPRTHPHTSFPCLSGIFITTPQSTTP
jgi:hypothetical protein